MTSDIDIAEAYRKAELRLRLLLFGDGADTPPLIKGDTPRQRVTIELKHLRNAFDALLDRERVSRAEIAEAASALENEVLMIAALRAEEHLAAEASRLLTPAEAAEMLGVSPSSVYRAVRSGQIQALRSADSRGAIRIPRGEVRRLQATQAAR